MAAKRILIVSLALAVAPMLGCKKKSNTTEQVQSPPASAVAPHTTGDPNMPNPNNAQAGSATMGTEATAVGAANNPMAGSGSAGSGAMAGSGAGSGSAGMMAGSGSAAMGSAH